MYITCMNKRNVCYTATVSLFSASEGFAVWAKTINGRQEYLFVPFRLAASTSCRTIKTLLCFLEVLAAKQNNKFER